jgi:hypothetical protein
MDGAAVSYAIGSHAGCADGDQSNRSHASGGPVGSNIQAEAAYSLRAGRTQSVAPLGAAAGNACAVDPQPDGRRYAACGDGVVSNVAEWIARRLADVIELVPQNEREARDAA